jgi:hypothetical protein
LRATAGQCPTDIRRLRGDLKDQPRKNGLLIRLLYRPPFCWSEALNFLRARSGIGRGGFLSEDSRS